MPPSKRSLPVRKQNRLATYDYSSDGAYFITVCTKDKKNLFWMNPHPDTVGEDSILPPFTVSLSPCGKIVEESILAIPMHYPHIHLSQYVIMPNHVHLMLSIVSNSGRILSSPTGIPTAIGQMKRYASKKASISLWQRSFHDHIVRDEKEYEQLIHYMYENPIRWQSDCLYAEE